MACGGPPAATAIDDGAVTPGDAGWTAGDPLAPAGDETPHSYEGCDRCHGLPPTPDRESYPGGGGAHLAHALLDGVLCRTCHGHEGGGPRHNEGADTVHRGNIDLEFDPAVRFPAGTTMNNGAQAAAWDDGGTTACRVGCHNPLPGDVANLANLSRWTAARPSCAECHDQPGIRPPRSHDLDPAASGGATLRAACETCHDVAGHRAGVVVVRDPDPTDASSFAAGGISGLCRTCHDGGTQTFFTAARQPADLGDFWSVPAGHATAALDCDTCHDPHGGADGSRLDPGPEEDVCFRCHDGTTNAPDVRADFERLPNDSRVFHHPVDDGEQFAGREVECGSCHDPHRATAAQPLAGVPGVGIDGTAVGPGTARPRELLAFELCLRCHGDTFHAARARATNKRTDFAPDNGSYHPVAAVGRNASTAMAASLLGGLTTASTLTCASCHGSDVALGAAGPHGSGQAFILRAAYWTDPTGPGTYAPSHYALCLGCHAEQAFVLDDAPLLTNFEDAQSNNLHARHMQGGADKGVTCTNCHYNTHGNASLTTTEYQVDGVALPAAPTHAKSRGVGFSPDVTGPGGSGLPTFAVDTVSRERTCSLTCHGKAHPSKTYLPTAGDDDSLTIP